jgi:hypothetical protein
MAQKGKLTEEIIGILREKLLVAEGWCVSVKRVYRVWRREGLRVPKRQPLQ